MTNGCIECHSLDGEEKQIFGETIVPSQLGLSDRAAERVEGLSGVDYI